jgi:ZIP family zinc transporter
VSPDHSATLAPVATPSRSPMLTAALALGPIVLLGALLALIVGGGLSGLGSGQAPPPVERVAVTRVDLSPGRITLSILNDGPDPVTIAQVAVDDAFWMFEMSPDRTLAHLDRGQLNIPYPWVHGETHVVRLMTSTGVTFDREIAVAVESPRPNLGQLGTFALIGLYVGVVPVAIGLLWYPLLGRIGTRGLQFLMALTIGLLAYLLVDATHDGLESAAAIPGSLQGPVLFVFGAVAAYLALEGVGGWLSHRRQQSRAASASPAGWVLAVLIAIGIGLHNFGEGLAIGSAFALGELALGTLLVVGFTLHNTTEGLAIVAPLARQSEAARVGLGKLVQLGLIGGAPTIVGAWLGAFAQSPTLAVIFLALGVGGIAQVMRQILVHSAGAGGVAAYFREAHVLSGLAAGVGVMYVTGMVVG